MIIQYCSKCYRDTEHIRINNSQKQLSCKKCILGSYYYKLNPELKKWEYTPQGCIPPSKLKNYDDACWRNANNDFNIKQDQRKIWLYCEHPNTELAKNMDEYDVCV